MSNLPQTDLTSTIKCGKELRKQKKICTGVANNLHLADETSLSLPNSSNNETIGLKHDKQTQSAPCTAKTSPTFRLSGASSSNGRRSPISRANRLPRCPLRIAELAEPTERHCIYTLRNKHDVLHPWMLEKLKQNVMDQKVIAKIPDAANCFKRRKAYTSKKRGERERREVKRSCGEPDLDDAKYLCAIFAQGVASLMYKPMDNLVLVDELQKLGEIVALEVIELIQLSKHYCADYVYDLQLLNEMSIRITYWISEILKDADEKIVEDVLRAEKTKEMKLGKEGDLITLIETYYRNLNQNEPSEKSWNPDLEEKEGPALDAFEFLIDSVLNLCGYKDEINSSVDDSNGKEDNDEENSGNVLDGDSSDDKQDGDSQNDLIKEAKDNLSTNASKRESQDEVNDESKDDMPSENSLKDNIGAKNLQEESQEKSVEKNYGSQYEFESIGDDTLYQDTIGDDEQFDVSPDNVTANETDDERKKVKFTNVQQGERADGRNEESRGNRSQNGGSRTSDDTELRISLESWPTAQSLTRLGTGIVFQSANASLLSDTDELWPDDIKTTSLRPSASATKSITSLGDIKEIDECNESFAPGIDNENNSLVVESVAKEHSNDDETLEVELNRKQNVPAMNGKGLLSSTSNDHTDPILDYTAITPAQLIDSIKASLQMCKNENPEDKDNYNLHLSDRFKAAGTGDHVDMVNNEEYDTDDNRKRIAETNEKKQQETRTKFEYRVCPQTAPPWALIQSSDESNTSSQIRIYMTPQLLRKWCKDLENTAINLEQWSYWLDITCKKIITLQHEKDKVCQPCRTNYRLEKWSNLKNYIDMDASRWRQLNRRYCEVLDSFSMPRNSKIEVEPSQNVTKCRRNCTNYKAKNMCRPQRNLKNVNNV